MNQGLGYAIVALGMWVTYCGYLGIQPIATLVSIIKNPAQARQIINAGSKRLQGSGGGTDGAAVVAFARAQIGKPYVFGATGPDGYDCSGLTQTAYKQIGINLPRLSNEQLLIGARISSKADLQPGDLIFPSIVGTIAGHVQIYSGMVNGTHMIIEAPSPGLKVRERNMWGFTGTDSVRASRPLTTKKAK